MNLCRRIRGRGRDEPADSDWLTVESGRVVCPRRGSLDIEICFTCAAFEGFTAGRVERLVCTGAATDGTSLLRLIG